jgi:hypothetical protein
MPDCSTLKKTVGFLKPATIKGVRPAREQIAAEAFSAFVRKPLEIGKHGRDQFLPARVLSSECRPKEIEQVAGLFRRFMPTRCRRRQEVRFQFILPKAQCLLVRFHVRE